MTAPMPPVDLDQLETAERWLPVVGYEGLYDVSSLGRVRSIARPGARGGIKKQHLRPDGYFEVLLSKENRGRIATTHRLVTAAFLGPRPAGMYTRHLNGDSQDNRIENLTYGTPSQNAVDMVQHGRHNQARKTHCIRGHSFLDPANVHIDPKGHRRCIPCIHLYSRKVPA